MGNQLVTYLETNCTDPAYNLAFEEYVLYNRLNGPYLLLWQNNNAVVIGQNQNAEAEVNQAFAQAHGVRIVRRITGGGAVYHDLGNLNYSFITDIQNAQTMTYRHFVQPVVAALQNLGLPAEASGRNDILIDGRKVSGTAQRLAGKRILFHGTLLFDSDPDLIAGALHTDPSKFQSKGTKSVRSRVGNIRSFLKEDMDLRAFWRYLRTYFGGDSMQADTLLPAELEKVRQLKAEKYDTWEWTFGHSPAFTYFNKRKWSGGLLEVGVQVTNGLIEDIRFYGDFLSMTSLDNLVDTLRGCRFQRQAIQEVLESSPLYLYFGSITQQEVLNTIFSDSEPI